MSFVSLRSALVVASVSMSGLVGCDPQDAGAQGQITVSAADPANFTTLEIRFYPDVSGSFDLTPYMQTDGESATYMVQSSTPLAEVTFPHEYVIDRGIGVSSQHVFRVVAWLATAATATWPDGTVPFATATVTIPRCDGFDDGYCEIVEGIDLTISPPGT
jgi:hypothetical protein